MLAPSNGLLVSSRLVYGVAARAPARPMSVSKRNIFYQLHNWLLLPPILQSISQGNQRTKIWALFEFASCNS